MTNPAATQNKEIDCLSPEAQRLAEARLAAKRAARAEVREIRMKELEQQQKEVEERPEEDFTEKGSRNPPSLSAATLASLGGTSSRRGSGDTSVSIDTEASMREIKDSLAEVEEKYKKAMVSNAQLDNEKTNYMYQVDSLKDTLLDLEEQLAESRRQFEEKSKEFEREKHAHGLLQFQFAEMKAALQQREEMLQALERRKEFFDAVRSEQDDLREEVVMLREELKKHGIILNSEVATNGETPDTLSNIGYQGPTKMTKDELNALQATGDGTLGKATEVEVKNGIVDNVGKREIVQNAERERHKEDPIEHGVDTEVLPPDDSAEDQRASENSAPSLAALADASDKDQVQSQVLGNASVLECREQVGASEVTSASVAGTGASLKQLDSSRELDGNMPGAGMEPGSCDALETENQREDSAEKQQQGKQGGRASAGEVSAEVHQDPAPSQVSEFEQVSGTQGTGQAGPTASAEQVGTVASSPPRGSNDTVSHGAKCVVDVPSTGCSLETELTNQEAVEPGARGFPVQSTGVGGESDEEDIAGKGLRSEMPVQTEVPTSPCSPAAIHSAQEATGSSIAGAYSEPLDMKEPSKENSALQGEGLDSPQKKTKNKKKKNKKKKSPAPTEELKALKEDSPLQNLDVSEVQEEEQVKCAEETPGVETWKGVPGSPRQNTVVGSGENPDVPENPNLELDGKLHPGGGDAVIEAGIAVPCGESAMAPAAEGVAQAGQGVRGVSESTPPASDGTAPAGMSKDSHSEGREECALS